MSTINNPTMNPEEGKIFNLLKGVIDPELMVNIVDLGLVYGVWLNTSEKVIDIDLTLTSPGCPMGDMIIEDITKLVETNYPECKVEIQLVWEPAWSLENLTEKGKEALAR